jgi:hypothetical protein
MRHWITRGLASAFLAGPWTQGELVARGREALGARPRWLPPLVRRVLARFPSPPHDAEDALLPMLRADEGLRAGANDRLAPARLVRWLWPEPAMIQVTGPPASFAIAPLPAHDVLRERLGLGPPALAWFSDLRFLNARAAGPRLHHYRHTWVKKARGGWRLLEAPKPHMKRIQRWVLRHVLGPIPPAPIAHGFVPGRDVRSFVAPHVGRAVVVRLDLEDFFASVGRARVVALLRRVGYPRAVARTLAGLCTAPTPDAVLEAHPREDGDGARRFHTNARLRDPHLPQGAPTSPALSNLAAWRLDRRLQALAARFGAAVTRYADDLAFGGDETFARSLRLFLPLVGAIAIEEGFRINYRKTRVMRRGRRQQLCGLVINARPGIPRRERDNLRALLFNAVRFGPDSQNRDGHADFRRHLEGKIAWVASINPAHGRRLSALFARIVWPPAGAHDRNP